MYVLYDLQYPVLLQRKREFNLLEKLYSLYLRVMQDVDSFLEIPWMDVDIEYINTKITGFQNECRRLPPGNHF